MKKIICILLLTGTFSSVSISAKAQSIDQLIIQLILDGQKLSGLKNILNDLYKGYEILDKGYSTIKDIAEGNFSLHKVFLDGLLTVSPTVRNYVRVVDIINTEATIVSEYKSAFNRFKADGHFSAYEIDYMGKLYNSLFKRSLKSIEELTMVITDNQMRMSDAERLESIDRIYGDIRGDLLYLRRFNNSTAVLGVQRARAANDINTLRNIYGIN